MTFDDIIGQEEAKQRLRTEMEQGKVPHALMFSGPEGCGAMPLAVAYAQMLLGNNVMAEKLQHPDLHFAFPIYKKNSKPTFCDDFIKEWRELILRSPYFGMQEWMDASGAENQQLVIYVDESDAIFKKLSLKSSQGGYKILIMWLPEKMHETNCPPFASTPLTILLSMTLQRCRRKLYEIASLPLQPETVQSARIGMLP